MHFFKFAFAYLGFLAYRPYGAILGFILGVGLDAGLEVRIRNKRAQKYARNVAVSRFNQTFIDSVFGMFEKVVEASGNTQPNAKERAVIDRIIKEGLRLTKQGKQAALTAYGKASASARTFNSYAIEFSELTQNDPQMINFLFDSLLALALADGELVENERKLLHGAATIFGIPVQQEPRQAQNRTSQEKQSTPEKQELSPYEILGCSPSDPEQTIKQQYRRLVHDYHPDKIISKELPEEFIKFANYKFDAIQKAYELIRKERRFS